MTSEDWEVHMKMLKENEAQRLSFNERRKWKAYLESNNQEDLKPAFQRTNSK